MNIANEKDRVDLASTLPVHVDPDVICVVRIVVVITTGQTFGVDGTIAAVLHCDHWLCQVLWHWLHHHIFF